MKMNSEGTFQMILMRSFIWVHSIWFKCLWFSVNKIYNPIFIEFTQYVRIILREFPKYKLSAMKKNWNKIFINFHLPNTLFCQIFSCFSAGRLIFLSPVSINGKMLIHLLSSILIDFITYFPTHLKCLHRMNTVYFEREYLMSVRR